MLEKNLPLTTEITIDRNMSVGGCDVVKLAEEFGTPLYVMDEETLRQNCRKYIEAFHSQYANSEVIYASKALSILSVLKIINEEGLGIDVVSSGELFTALKAGFSPEKIYYHGNNKSEEELKEAIKEKVGCIIVDNLFEMEMLDRLSKEAGVKTQIMVRVTPGVEAHTHTYVQTGQLDSKFGIHADEMVNAIKKIEKMKNLNFIGLHVHIGSQILDVRPFSVAVEIMIDLISEIHKKTKARVNVLSLGGGLGIAYMPKDDPPKVEQYVKTIVDTISYKMKEKDIELPKIIIEPGRSIVGNAGITLYKIGAIKDLKGIRKYVMVDGGMTDNPRPIIYQSKYDALIANKIEEKKTDLVTVAGKYCESGDILLKDISLQKVEPGDILAVLCTGAYNFSMASNYNQAFKPAMVMVNSGNAKIIYRRQTNEELIANME